MAEENKPAAPATGTQTPAQGATSQGSVAQAPATATSAEPKVEVKQEPAKQEPAKQEQAKEGAGKKDDAPEMVPRYEMQIRDQLDDMGLRVSSKVRERLVKLYVADGKPGDISAWLKDNAETLGLKVGEANAAKDPAQVPQGSSGAAASDASSALPMDIKKVTRAQWKAASDAQRRAWWQDFERRSGIGGDPRLAKHRNGQNAQRKE